MQAAHNPPPNVGYPHAGQIVMRFPSGGVLMATAVSFAVSERVPLHSPLMPRAEKTQGSDVVRAAAQHQLQHSRRARPPASLA